MLNGVPIYFEVHGSADPLLLLHGFSGCSQDWSAFVEGPKHAAKEKFQLIIPDLRGHGRSFAPREGGLASTKSAQPGVAVLPELSAWRHDQAAADMFALLDRLGIETFKGLGVSGG
jgi:pimeloyl-ACP methyl ester carboxylesterase